jgi:hypothetical protein
MENIDIGHCQRSNGGLQTGIRAVPFKKRVSTLADGRFSCASRYFAIDFNRGVSFRGVPRSCIIHASSPRWEPPTDGSPPPDPCVNAAILSHYRRESQSESVRGRSIWISRRRASALFEDQIIIPWRVFQFPRFRDDVRVALTGYKISTL